jgi:hypothetical protein
LSGVTLPDLKRAIQEKNIPVLTAISGIGQKTAERVIIEHKEDMHPQLLLVGEKDEILAFYPIPTGAHIVVKDGQSITGGTLLAKTPRKVAKG